MSAMPGAGLLAMLRRRSDASDVTVAAANSSGPAVVTSTASSKFEARSSAVQALEHAVASGRTSEAARSAAQGRRIPAGPSYVYDIDVHVPHEAQPQLPVNPVTLISTEYALHHHRLNAVSPAYLCYGLKQGHIRLLSRHSALRALLKGHTKPLTDLQFAGGAVQLGSSDASTPASGGNLLASGGQDGQLFVWQLWLDEAAGAIRETQKLQANFVTAAGPAGSVFLSWHTPSQRVLAVGVGGKVLLVSVPSEGMEQLNFELDGDSTPDAAVLPDWTGEPVCCLSFSPDGQLLAAGGADGTVRVWQLQSSAATSAGGSPILVACGSTAVPAGPPGTAVGAVRWLPTSDGWVLLTGNANNATLRLWHTPAHAPCGAWTPLQRLAFDGKDGQKEFFIHVDVVPSQQLVVLADTARKGVYTLHYSGEGAALRFDYIARFGVAVPILSFAAAWSPTPAAGDGGGEQQDAPHVELHCVQTTAIQQYSLDPQLCYDGTAAGESEGTEEPALDDGVVRRSSLLERDGKDVRQLSIRAQPSTAVPMPSAELASGGTPRREGSQASSRASSRAGSVAAASPSPQKAVLPSPPPLPAGAAPVVEPAAAEAGGLPVAEPSIEGRVSLAGILPPPAPRSESAELQGTSGDVTPEECPSPPPTPTEQRRLHEAAEAEAEVAGAAAAPVAPQNPPLLLTPSDLLQSATSSTATTGRSSPAAATSASSRAAPPQAQQAQRAPMPPRPMPAAVPAAALPPRQDAAVGTADDAAAAAAAFALPSAAAVTAALVDPAAAAAAQEAAVAAAVLEQMGGVHKKFVGHVSLMYRELLKAMKLEMTSQAAQQQQATAALLAAALENQKQQIEAERAAVLAEERANIERLLTAISGTLNRDLPAKLQEAVRGELSGLGDSLAASLAPAVTQALAGGLPKELATALKAAGVDGKQLAPALSAGLGKPLQEALRTSFTKQVVPAFEGATQAMFQQMQAALTAGLEEHLQASQAALTEPTALASQLAASLASAQSLASSLNQGQQQLQLMRAQSVAGTGGTRSPSAAPVDVRSELSSLLKAGKHEQAFTKALGLQDVSTVGWLATQADAPTVLSQEPCPLSQLVLLSLVQQLSADLTTHLAAKLAWIREATMLIDPQDVQMARHVKPVLEGVHSALQAAAARVSGKDASSCRLTMHVVHSQMSS